MVLPRALNDMAHLSIDTKYISTMALHLVENVLEFEAQSSDHGCAVETCSDTILAGFLFNAFGVSADGNAKVDAEPFNLSIASTNSVLQIQLGGIQFSRIGLHKEIPVDNVLSTPHSE